MLKLRGQFPLSTAGALFPWQSDVTKFTVNHDARALCQPLKFVSNSVYRWLPNASQHFDKVWHELMEHSDVSGWNTGVPPHCRGVAG